MKLPSCVQKCVFFPLFIGTKGLEMSVSPSSSWQPHGDALTHCASRVHGSVFMLLGYDLLQTCYFWLWRWLGSQNTVDSSKKTCQISHTFSHTTKFLSVCETELAGVTKEVRISKLLWVLPLVWEFVLHLTLSEILKGRRNLVCTCLCVHVWTHHCAGPCNNCAALDIHMVSMTAHFPVTIRSQF